MVVSLFFVWVSITLGRCVEILPSGTGCAKKGTEYTLLFKKYALLLISVFRIAGVISLIGQNLFIILLEDKLDFSFIGHQKVADVNAHVYKIVSWFKFDKQMRVYQNCSRRYKKPKIKRF